MSCGTQERTAIACPLCGRLYCAVCYPAHRKIEKNRPFPPLLADKEAITLPRKEAFKDTEDNYQTAPISKAQRMQIARQRQEAYKKRLAGEMANELKDTEGTPTPAATTPKIYRGGGGSPDEPPEAAGAPNRPRIEARRREQA